MKILSSFFSTKCVFIFHRLKLCGLRMLYQGLLLTGIHHRSPLFQNQNGQSSNFWKHLRGLVTLCSWTDFPRQMNTCKKLSLHVQNLSIIRLSFIQRTLPRIRLISKNQPPSPELPSQVSLTKYFLHRCTPYLVCFFSRT
jgi:hypothetical protein